MIIPNSGLKTSGLLKAPALFFLDKNIIIRSKQLLALLQGSIQVNVTVRTISSDLARCARNYN